MKREIFISKNEKDYQFIENDNLFICQRLREIDKSYRIVYNLKKEQFEVHCLSQPNDSYAFSIPYKELDERTISYALKTRCQNMDKLIEEIDKHNEELYNQMVKKQTDKIKEALC